MISLIEYTVAGIAVAFAVLGIAGIVALSNNYEGVMDRTDKLVAVFAAVFVALYGYVALF